MKADDALRMRLGRLFVEASDVVLIDADAAAPWIARPTRSLEADAPASSADGAVVGVRQEEGLRAAVARAAATTRPGGIVALVTLPAGGRVRGAFRRLLRRASPVSLEALCEALLLEHLEDVRADDPTRAGAVAWARVRAPRAR